MHITKVFLGDQSLSIDVDKVQWQMKILTTSETVIVAWASNLTKKYSSTG